MFEVKLPPELEVRLFTRIFLYGLRFTVDGMGIDSGIFYAGCILASVVVIWQKHNIRVVRIHQIKGFSTIACADLNWLAIVCEGYDSNNIT